MGQKFAAYDANGNVTAFYDSTDSPVPAGVNAIEITDTQWQTCLNQAGWTVVSGVLVAPPAPTAAQLLAQAQVAQITKLTAAYEAAITAPVSYTTVGGATATFTQSATNTQNLQNALVASAKSQSWPLNLWLNSSGQPVTPFTYADLQGLAAAMEAADTPEYMDLLTKVAAVNAATTVAAVQSVTF
jgi:hypothetical protein